MDQQAEKGFTPYAHARLELTEIQPPSAALTTNEAAHKEAAQSRRHTLIRFLSVHLALLSGGRSSQENMKQER